jgi:hypothetical protein
MRLSPPIIHRSHVGQQPHSQSFNQTLGFLSLLPGVILVQKMQPRCRGWQQFWNEVTTDIAHRIFYSMVFTSMIRPSATVWLAYEQLWLDEALSAVTARQSTVK